MKKHILTLFTISQVLFLYCIMASASAQSSNQAPTQQEQMQQAPPQQQQYQDQTKSQDQQDIRSQAENTAQDVSGQARATAQDVNTALIAAQVKANNDTLAMMNAQNTFWLQVLQTIMPILSAIGIAVVGWLQLKAARERSLMAASINGLKTELVATTRAAAFYEGRSLQADNAVSSQDVAARGRELSDAARQAGVDAHHLAAKAAGEKPGKVTMTPHPVDTLSLKPGESASAESLPGGGASITKDV